MQERRHLTRRPLIYSLRVFDLDSGDDVGHLADITTEGMLVMRTRDVDHDFMDTAFKVTSLAVGHRRRIETLIDDYGCRD